MIINIIVIVSIVLVLFIIGMIIYIRRPYGQYTKMKGKMVTKDLKRTLKRMRNK